MGEKGNAGDVPAVAAAAAAPSLVERVTTTATETVTGVGEDFFSTVKDKTVGAMADNTVAAARERLQRRTQPQNPDQESPARTDQGGGTGTGS
ncbi:hypothetical protein [Nakamurella endophytica]|uniref:Uncharacterized protein n=1 Tax=Nakamurella endophytica TaxID=1748367 RepID=A0A917WKD8_9ACTN|nr:hypothetical protein [Nakamurella endophytica]GGM12264.1 hypothetical protein GCM10011594_35160 [Nakamurella endophytica]